MEDEWANIQRTAEWLHATRDFSGKRLDECIFVLQWVRGESACKGPLCIHARDLTREWQARCPKIADQGEVDHADVDELLEQYTARSREEPTPCGKEAEDILKNGCGKGNTCLDAANSWATRCGKSDGTPLIVRMLERSVERRMPEPKRVKLDTRSCEDLQEELKESTTCGNQFECEEAARKVTAYRARCEVGGARPTALVASYQLAILDRAGQPTVPIPLVIGASFSPKETPMALADGLGMVMAVCNTPVKTLEGYLTARRTCKGGSLQFTGIVKEQGEPKAKLGRLEIPDDGTLLARLPSLVVTGEMELREKQALAALGPELDQVAALARSRPGDALTALVHVLKPYRSMLKRSALLRKSIAVRDEELAPIFRELGKNKQAASKAKMERPMFLGFVNRAKERMLADVTEEGAVEAGAIGPLDWLETSELLPRSTEVMLESMRLAVAQAKVIRVDRRTEGVARAYGQEQAQACGDGFKALGEAQRGLIKCALGLDPCDEDKIQQIGKQNDEARNKIDAARHQLDLVMSGPGSSIRSELREAMTSAGCNVPWW